MYKSCLFAKVMFFSEKEAPGRAFASVSPWTARDPSWVTTARLTFSSESLVAAITSSFASLSPWTARGPSWGTAACLTQTSK